MLSIEARSLGVCTLCVFYLDLLFVFKVTTPNLHSRNRPAKEKSAGKKSALAGQRIGEWKVVSPEKAPHQAGKGSCVSLLGLTMAQ